MGVEIGKRYTPAKQGLWSASVLIDRPDIVMAVHQDFIRAGARMIITNTYSTIPSYLGKAGRAQEYRALTTLGGTLARRAADDSGESVQVAGSLPPLSESYRPDLVPAVEASLPIYRNLVEALASNDAVIVYGAGRPPPALPGRCGPDADFNALDCHGG